MNEKNIFQKIIDGEIPATKIYEDDKFLAFLDIAPISMGHTLLIPKINYEWMQDMPDDLTADLFIKTKELMKAIIKGVGCDFVQISVVGKDVPHVHVHLIPRKMNDGLVGWNTKNYKDQDEMIEYAKKISESIS